MIPLLAAVVLLQSDPSSWKLREELPPLEKQEIRARLASWIAEGGEPELQAEASRLAVTSAEYLHAYRLELEWEVEVRRAERVSEPLKGEPPEPPTVERVDVWSVERPAGEAPPHGWRVAVPGSARVLDCRTCSASGRVGCGSCRRSGQVACGRCSGRGETTCGTCGGSTKVSCKSCGGSGRQRRGGERRTCLTCGGIGRKNCGSCSNGRTDCTNCPDGRVRCGRCSGAKDLVCGSCHGAGRLVDRQVVVIERLRPSEVARVGTPSGHATEIARYGDGLIEPLSGAIEESSIREAARGLLARPVPDGKILARALVVRRSTVVRVLCGDWTAEIADREIRADPSPRKRWAQARIGEAREALGRGDLDAAEKSATRARAVDASLGEADELLDRVGRERAMARQLELKARAEADRRRSCIVGLAVGAGVLVVLAFAISGVVYLVVRNRAS